MPEAAGRAGAVSCDAMALAELPSHAGAIAELAQRIARHAHVDGIHPTGVPGVSAIRRSQPHAECFHILHRPAVCFIAQGAKELIVDDAVQVQDASRLLVLSVDLPVKGRVVEASVDRPYLCLRVEIAPADVAEQLLRLPPGRVVGDGTRGLYQRAASAPLVDAAVRLLRAAPDPHEAESLAPLAIQEILIRLLTGEHGARLAHVARPDGQGPRVVRAIEWLKRHFAEPMRIDDLARQVHMSPSSLHQHFRAVTAMSPLQFQKQLRLQEARRLLLEGGQDVARAAERVGYASASQFSRDYARLFGAAPSHDLQRLRATRVPAAA
jgi:AraC-like DNA-binding protein